MNKELMIDAIKKALAQTKEDLTTEGLPPIKARAIQASIDSILRNGGIAIDRVMHDEPDDAFSRVLYCRFVEGEDFDSTAPIWTPVIEVFDKEIT